MSERDIKIRSMQDVKEDKGIVTRKRFQSKLYSLDQAFGGGIPVGSIYEIYGYTHVGKSSLAYYLAMKAAQERALCIADFEGYDLGYIASTAELAGYDISKVFMVDNPVAEEGLTALRNAIHKDDFGAGILDTVGAMVLEEEMESDIDLQERLGQKPKLMAKAMRQFAYSLKKNPEACIFVLNHLHPIITLGRGSTTSGGVAIHNLSAGRIRLSVEKSDQKYSVVQGRTDKYRYGGKGKNFKFGIINGRGVHPGFTDLIDCIWLGYAEESRTIKMDGESYGYMKNITDAAYEGDDSVFEPFVERMNKVRDSVGISNAEDDEESED